MGKGIGGGRHSRELLTEKGVKVEIEGMVCDGTNSQTFFAVLVDGLGE